MGNVFRNRSVLISTSGLGTLAAVVYLWSSPSPWPFIMPSQFHQLLPIPSLKEKECDWGPTGLVLGVEQLTGLSLLSSF